MKVECPSLVFWGSLGLMGRMFDMEAVWKTRLAHVTAASLPGGHFFPDQFPRETAGIVLAHLARAHAIIR